jgi:small multidrug resistance pump
MGYLYLAGAIISEVVATSFLKYASGPKNVWWAYLIVGVGYVLSFVLLSITLRSGVPLVFHESLTWQQIVGMVLVIGGVGLLELGAKR